MKKVNFTDIEMAYDFVNCTGYLGNSAVIHRKTGEIYYLGDDLDNDLPDDFDEDDEALLSIHDKYDLELGSNIVMDFAHEYCSDDLEEIQFIFSHKGAYAHFKRLLSKKGRLEKWYEFEQEKTETALLKWCKIN
ncbi:MAG: hypothetical protein JXR91_16065 [Deltaproteobacteria bacterium]|nr:hypothetical protein [Deltaproteobacteria bacterium]